MLRWRWLCPQGSVCIAPVILTINVGGGHCLSASRHREGLLPWKWWARGTPELPPGLEGV